MRKTLKTWTSNREHCSEIQLCFNGVWTSSGKKRGFYEIWTLDPHGVEEPEQGIINWDVPVWDCIALERCTQKSVAQMYKRAKALATRA